MQANLITASLKDNPELQEALSRKRIGEKCTMEVTFQLDSLDENQFSGSIESMAPVEGYEKEEAAGGPEEAVGGSDEAKKSPALLVMMKPKPKGD